MTVTIIPTSSGEAVRYRVLLFGARWYSVLQCVAVCCSVLWREVLSGEACNVTLMKLSCHTERERERERERSERQRKRDILKDRKMRQK